jgi:beta-glucanase (GH16 family)
MDIRRHSLGLASTLLLTAAVAPGAASALPIRIPTPATDSLLSSTKSVHLRERVASTGVYAVTVAVTAHSSANSLVNLTIGNVSRHAHTTRNARRVTIKQDVAVEGKAITVVASERNTKPSVSVTWHRVGSVKPSTSTSTGSGGSTRGSSGSSGSGTKTDVVGSSGTQGSTGATGSTGAGSTGSSGTTGSAPVAGPPGDPSTWHSIFDDEFSNNSLSGSDWTTGWYGSGITQPVNTTAELECLDPSHVVEGSGELDLNLTATPETCDSSSGELNEPNASGMVTTTGKFSYTYGYMEARVWVPGSSSVDDWPQVWEVGQGGQWPQDGELDVMEGLGGSACYHFHDPSGGPGGCASGNFAGGWHTFGADWEPGIVTWYYDGVDVGSVTSGITSSPMYLLLTLAVDHTYGGPVLTPATMRIDYVRVWQHNAS